ncbi:MAG: siderophore-interacting protein [Acidimicrobiales bacterium]
MTSDDGSLDRLRREPPAFRRVDVAAVAPRNPHLVAMTLSGPELVGFDIGLPAASVRLLLPRQGRTDLVIPTWNGNEFRHDDGQRPLLRTLTPRRNDHEAGTLDVEIVVHEGGPMSEWAMIAQPGDPAAISGPGRGYEISSDATRFLLAGDESASPAISQLLEALPRSAEVEVLLEVAHPDARVDLPVHPGAAVRWVDLPAETRPGDALLSAVAASELLGGSEDATADGLKVWVAGEAAAVQRIRKHLFEERGLTRTQAVVRGYWKHGRSGAA